MASRHPTGSHRGIALSRPRYRLEAAGALLFRTYHTSSRAVNIHAARHYQAMPTSLRSSAPEDFRQAHLEPMTSATSRGMAVLLSHWRVIARAIRDARGAQG